ncbi:hypothetical protein F5Y12DRAFT_303013 [Xylaria sp. FL1777]|nr:hypothetical protein F5Y12DRAFT_303013 [Xylaria sp. FL1777]
MIRYQLYFISWGSPAVLHLSTSTICWSIQCQELKVYRKWNIPLKAKWKGPVPGAWDRERHPLRVHSEGLSSETQYPSEGSQTKALSY